MPKFSSNESWHVSYISISAHLQNTWTQFTDIHCTFKKEVSKWADDLLNTLLHVRPLNPETVESNSFLPFSVKAQDL